MPRFAGRPAIALTAICLALTACSGQTMENGTDTDGSQESATGTVDQPGRSSGAIVAAEHPSCDARPPEGVSRFDLEGGGTTAGVRVYVPPAADTTLLPVVLDWHGLGSDGPQQALLTGYEDLARREGFVAVHPSGPRGFGGQASWELVQFDLPDRDDVVLAATLIDRLVADFCVDPDRVYSTGLSNGGFFTARLVCELSDRIAAAVSVAGVSHPDGCHPTRPVPYLAYHGTADQIVPYDGGGSTLVLGAADVGAAAFFDQVMPDEFAEFAADFGCDPQSGATPIGDEVIRHDYTGCDGDVVLAFHEIEGGGHTWPGSPLGPLLTGALGRTTDEVAATADGWAFMSRFTLDGPTG